MTVVAVTGLRAEARLAESAGLKAVCAGGNPRGTAAGIERAIAEGARGLVSFGIAGGLGPQLRAGTLIVARAVLAPDGTRYAVDGAWADALQRSTGALEGDILGGEAIAATVARKSGLHTRTGAVAVDLESLVVARAAHRARLPFIALRAIADPATRDLPRAALIPLSNDGAPNLPRVLISVLTGPGQIPGLIKTALETRCALRALARGVERAGPHLACYVR